MNDLLEMEQSACFWQSESLRAQEFSPLSERAGKEQPELAASLAVLKEKIGDADFAKYFENLITMKKSENSLFLITQRGLQRSLLEYMFVPVLKEVFAVNDVRVVSQK